MRLPLTGLLGCGLLRVFRTACRLSPISCVCSFAVPLFFCIFFSAVFCLYFFSLYVSVLVSSCAVSPVSLFLVSDTRVSCIPRPGCQTCQDPDVGHVKIRVLCNAFPYLRVFFQPSVAFFPRACAYIIMYHFCQTFHPP